MAPSSLFPTVAPTKTPGDPVVFGEYIFFYLVHQRRTLSAMDNIDFMSRTQCKTYQDINRMKLVGDYVEVSSLRLHLSPLPFLPTVIPFLIRLVFFQLTGMLALLIV